MSEFITLSCPSCNGKLQITEDIERFACAHCGNEHMVKRSGGIVSLKPVFEAITKGVDNTASELAIVRLDKEIAELETKYLPLETSVEAAGGYLAVSILLFIVGAAVWIFSECAAGGVILISIGFFLLLAFVNGRDKRAETEKIEEKLKELKASRKAHYERVNNM